MSWEPPTSAHALDLTGVGSSRVVRLYPGLWMLVELVGVKVSFQDLYVNDNFLWLAFLQYLLFYFKQHFTLFPVFFCLRKTSMKCITLSMCWQDNSLKWILHFAVILLLFVLYYVLRLLVGHEWHYGMFIISHESDDC